MSAIKVTKFRNLSNHDLFSPAPGTVGSQFVYSKRVNGICPKYRANDEVGIFYPNDLVVQVKRSHS